jgi:hypothetical protein
MLYVERNRVDHREQRQREKEEEEKEGADRGV